MTDWGSCVKRMCATPYFLLNSTLLFCPDWVLYVLMESSSPAVTRRSSTRWKSKELMRSAVSCASGTQFAAHGLGKVQLHMSGGQDNHLENLGYAKGSDHIIVQLHPSIVKQVAMVASPTSLCTLLMSCSECLHLRSIKLLLGKVVDLDECVHKPL